MKLYFKCEEAAHICDKHQYKEISFSDSLRMRIHLFLCKFCREYSERNGKLTKTIKASNIKTLPLEDKELLKDRLAQEMNNSSDS